MRNLTLLLSLFFCHVLFTSSFAVAQSAPAKPLKIVTLSPQGTELAFAAGLGDYIIGVSEHSDYPEAANHIERIANHRGINLERVVALDPDLILAWEGGNPAQQLLKLRQLGYEVLNTYPTDLEQIAVILNTLSTYSPHPEQGQQAAKAFTAHLNALRQRYADADATRFFYQLASTPLMTMNAAAWPGPIFELCQGENVFSDSRVPYPQINIEQILYRQPDVIFMPSDHNIDATMWQRWQGKLPAVDNDRIIQLNSAWLNRATPRSLYAAEEVCRQLHPDIEPLSSQESPQDQGE
ncbi:vitamin B12 ABC transporter substrate-binding protein BtuF [Thaumasiovibrio subtropicus]|uniref:vitamin B12 ABC transporter substrate-binding protein BtuF n=1 Tax=Thaumasiovibrio subtropicus TaxID=1891207 RepID=UPI000B34C74E|nr:vitamin B12 ABC transporter substrate-binding protein BtuF [Thaumasiovibrio subtropicus]